MDLQPDPVAEAVADTHTLLLVNQRGSAPPWPRMPHAAMLALGALDGLRADNPAASLSAIIGFDDIPQADWQPYQLTTVQQNTALLAHHAVDLLVTRIAKFSLPSRHREVPVKLIVRQSAK